MASAYNFKLTALAGESEVSFHFHFYVGVTYYISLYVREKQLVFHLSPRDGHVITVSACLILTDPHMDGLQSVNFSKRDI